ncbi:hypothetical protein EJ04DRAFT_589553 [Polyplosphaeria fusca]|uniref:Uncharacterized protein n=1 Tax=Polyplosphaeria fusca TaxID=682080 RepID=A0A9P4QQD5_9PLEO|nr:hypothetical protein EJ04DRAFT_589553 [Polyplosphaeria fusca]
MAACCSTTNVRPGLLMHAGAGAGPGNEKLQSCTTWPPRASGDCQIARLPDCRHRPAAAPSLLFLFARADTACRMAACDAVDAAHELQEHKAAGPAVLGRRAKEEGVTKELSGPLGQQLGAERDRRQETEARRRPRDGAWRAVGPFGATLAAGRRGGRWERLLDLAERARTGQSGSLAQRGRERPPWGWFWRS